MLKNSYFPFCLESPLTWQSHPSVTPAYGSLNFPASSVFSFTGCGSISSRKSLPETDLLPICQAQAGGSSLSRSCAWGASFSNWFGLGSSLSTLASHWLVQSWASQLESNVCRHSEEESSKHSSVTTMHPSLGKNPQHLPALCWGEVSDGRSP